MSQLKALSLLTLGLLCLVFKTDAQQLLNRTEFPAGFTGRIFQKLQNKNQGVTNGLERTSAEYLSRISGLELKMKKKLARKDSGAAERIFGDVVQRYSSYSDKIGDGTQHLKKSGHKYIPHLDTLKTALKFMSANLDADNVQSLTQIKEVMRGVSQVQERFNQADEVNKFIQQRRAFLHEHLAKFGLSKDAKTLMKHVYYYQAQVGEYRKILDDPSQLENKIIQSVKQMSAFKEFFNTNAQLAGLFRLPDNFYSNPVFNIDGLQTREGIGLEMIQRYGSGPDIQQMMKQNLIAGQSQLGQLKEKIIKAGADRNDLDMPDFKPNHQKTKGIKERLEFGTNFQTVKANRYFPSTSDVGLSIGYKLNNKSIVGVGGSYKVGWGESIRRISITHQGIGFRSFFDYKLEKGIWVSGGAELNYRQHFRDFEILDDYAAWQKSALVGLSKKYQISKRFKGNLQFMYDFLWKQQVVRGQPIIFRVGYTF